MNQVRTTEYLLVGTSPPMYSRVFHCRKSLILEPRKEVKQDLSRPSSSKYVK